MTFRYVFHTGWNTLKIISRLIGLMFMLGLSLTPRSAIYSQFAEHGSASARLTGSYIDRPISFAFEINGQLMGSN